MAEKQSELLEACPLCPLSDHMHCVIDFMFVTLSGMN